MIHPRELTSNERDRLVHLLTEEPASVIEYFPDPESQRLNSPNTLLTAVNQKSREFELWSTDDDSDLKCEGIFATMGEALVAERELSARVLHDADEWLTTQMDEEWANRSPCHIKWEYPLSFSDNTDFPDGWELSSWEEVLDFFQRIRPHVFEPEEPGCAYQWNLEDACGREWAPIRSHRGEIRLEEPETQRDNT